MIEHITNVVLGLLPMMALEGSRASDERQTSEERVVATPEDAARQRTVFLLVCSLWWLTLAMWNWMRGWHPAWIALWVVAGVVAGAMWGRRTRGRGPG